MSKHSTRTSQDAVKPVLEEAAARVERAISWVRIVFCAVVFVRFVLVTPSLTVSRLLVTAIPIALLSAFSIWILTRPKSRLEQHVLTASVIMDAAACFFVLLPNALWPVPEWPGLLRKPDLATLLLVLFAGGFRLSLQAAATSSLFNFLSFAGLVAVDRLVSGEAANVHVLSVSFYVILLGGASTLAMLVAWRTGALVADGAQRTILAETGRRNLALLLRDHHDVRTLLSTATLGTDVAARALTKAEPDVAAEHLSRVQRSLREVNQFSRAVRELSLTELLGQEEVVPIDLADFARHLVETLQVRYLDLEVTVEVLGTVPDALFAGGAVALQRTIHRLLDNAVEGRGDRRASAVQITASKTSVGVTLVIEDDGPGFSSESLSSPDPSGQTTKPEGLGIGLLLVNEAAKRSGGALVRSNRPKGGARVILRLEESEARLT